ncbi:PssE/Cps14G family polysaccharide biosynthesis glycosyltransferase [Desnuesiella massiliensis]|uniref:PssE/Cps14G family polysaccharide biosynthesis glycosyltransferase n=1 Tax=Desnuesiella massiliensis TaxID=1650662 RepID=UPI0006E29010|nr:PssE/Cps14G family polysaccharide biosynthesis glycosyltransferase [Desnuesiella massiliensis]
MIFITLGSQKFQFNRVLKEVDKLIEKGVIKEQVYAQIGYSDYKPKNYSYENFVDRNTFSKFMDNCDLLITHGGTGAIITGVKKEKKVIAIPRLKKYGEHVDDHKLDIVSQFKDMGFIYAVYDVQELGEALTLIRGMSFKRYHSNTTAVIQIIDDFINLNL